MREGGSLHNKYFLLYYIPEYFKLQNSGLVVFYMGLDTMVCFVAQQVVISKPLYIHIVLRFAATIF
jgi:hypothetical protein